MCCEQEEVHEACSVRSVKHSKSSGTLLGTYQKLAGGRGGGNFKFGFGN